MFRLHVTTQDNILPLSLARISCSDRFGQVTRGKGAGQSGSQALISMHCFFSGQNKYISWQVKVTDVERGRRQYRIVASRMKHRF